jgi:hypothetical protein
MGTAHAETSNTQALQPPLLTYLEGPAHNREAAASQASKGGTVTTTI